MKLTTLIIGFPRVRYALGSQSLARPNRPHISSDSINVKEQGNKNNRQHQSLGASSHPHLQFSVCFQSLALPSATFRNHRRFGEGSSTDTDKPPQPPFSKIPKLSPSTPKMPRKHWTKSTPRKARQNPPRNFIAMQCGITMENFPAKAGELPWAGNRRPTGGGLGSVRAGRALTARVEQA